MSCAGDFEQTRAVVGSSGVSTLNPQKRRAQHFHFLCCLPARLPLSALCYIRSLGAQTFRMVSRGGLGWLEAHTYDAQGRGLTSSRAYGVDSVSPSY